MLNLEEYKLDQRRVNHIVWVRSDNECYAALNSSNMLSREDPLREYLAIEGAKITSSLARQAGHKLQLRLIVCKNLGKGGNHVDSSFETHEENGELAISLKEKSEKMADDLSKKLSEKFTLTLDVCRMY